MRPWANAPGGAGFRVSLPRLPGHGTRWEELNETVWTDWYDAADRAFARLAAQCDQVFLAGLSMGATLCLRLAEEHGAAVSRPRPGQPGDQHHRTRGSGCCRC